MIYLFLKRLKHSIGTGHILGNIVIQVTYCYKIILSYCMFLVRIFQEKNDNVPDQLKDHL